MLLPLFVLVRLHYRPLRHLTFLRLSQELGLVNSIFFLASVAVADQLVDSLIHWSSAVNHQKYSWFDFVVDYYLDQTFSILSCSRITIVSLPYYFQFHDFSNHIQNFSFLCLKKLHGFSGTFSSWGLGLSVKVQTRSAASYWRHQLNFLSKFDRFWVELFH